MVVHTCNPSSEVGTGGEDSIQNQAHDTEYGPLGQNETLPQKMQRRKRKGGGSTC